MGYKTPNNGPNTNILPSTIPLLKMFLSNSTDCMVIVDLLNTNGRRTHVMIHVDKVMVIGKYLIYSANIAEVGANEVDAFCQFFMV